MDSNINDMQQEFDIIKMALEQVEDWVVLTDKKGIVLYANSAVEKISGYKKEELVGNNLNRLKSNMMPDETYSNLWTNLLKGENFDCVFANRHKNGEVYYVANSIYPVKNKNMELEYFISMGKELHSDDELTQQIHETMHYDKLTGLLNRNSFLENLSQTKWAKENVAVIVIKILRLGIINKQFSFGHGEHAIKEVSNKIKYILNEDVIFSRIDGNVLALSMTDYKNTHNLTRLIKQIEELFKEPIKVKGQELYISLAFGIATHNSNDGEINAGNLLANAQIALSQVKIVNSPEKYEFYTSYMNDEMQNRVEIENKIYAAYKNNEFIPYFQPIINLKTGQVASLEALVRWKQENGELVPPGKFIKILEETGLIVEVGYRLMEQICQKIRNWREQYHFSHPIAINLSPVQFKDKSFEEKVLQLFEKESIPPELITFEITESTFIEDIELTKKTLEAIKSKGFNVSIDDFGTGYSSLAYLQKLKINTIKIDMSFIKNIVENEGDQIIVKAVTMMAKGLGLKTVAEGIETREQLEMAKKLGCDKGQGYYWSKPLPAEEIILICSENKNMQVV